MGGGAPALCFLLCVSAIKLVTHLQLVSCTAIRMGHGQTSKHVVCCAALLFHPSVGNGNSDTFQGPVVCFARVNYFILSG